MRLYGEIDGVPTVTEPLLLKRTSHGELLRLFVDSVLEGTLISPSGEEGLDRVRLIEAIYRSAELGQEVAVDSVEMDSGYELGAAQGVAQ